MRLLKYIISGIIFLLVPKVLHCLLLFICGLANANIECFNSYSFAPEISLTPDDTPTKQGAIF